MISTQIPLCVAGVRDYFSKHGPPPMITKTAGTLLKHNFNHDSSEFKAEFNCHLTQWTKVTQLYISPKRYPNGVNVSVAPQEGFSAIWDEKKVLFLAFSRSSLPSSPSFIWFLKFIPFFFRALFGFYFFWLLQKILQLGHSEEAEDHTYSIVIQKRQSSPFQVMVNGQLTLLEEIPEEYIDNFSSFHLPL